METGKIISISSNTPSLEEFKKLMLYTEEKFNEVSRENPNLYYKINASTLENKSLDIIRSVCSNTEFNPEDIELVSGHKFPDIRAHVQYGVEVKSTEGKTWTSTGSSIVETTRIKDVNHIYLLFGKLGTNPPEFKCRPYDTVLREISVTHSPRYTVDMELTSGETIFDKMGISYEDFRRDEDKIERVKEYYRKISKTDRRSAPQWWLGKESPVNLEIMHYGFNRDRKKELVAEMLILFDELINGDYTEAAAWLCTRKFIINPSFRDLFSAGGKVIGLNYKKLKQPYPHIVGCILEHLPHIIKKLSSNDIELIEDISSLWKINSLPSDLFEAWILRIEKRFADKKSLKNVKIRELINMRPINIEYKDKVIRCSYD